MTYFYLFPFVVYLESVVFYLDFRIKFFLQPLAEIVLC